MLHHSRMIKVNLIINPRKFIHRLRTRDITYRLMKNKPYVKANYIVSYCGVPQGSKYCGSPSFYYFHKDICNIPDLMFAIMYADDTYFLINSTDKNKLIKQLNVELKTWNHLYMYMVQIQQFFF